MKRLFQDIFNKASVIKVMGAIITIFGLATMYLSGEIKEDAKKGMMLLDQAKLGEAKLK